MPGIGVTIENNVVQFTRSDEETSPARFHGLMRALVANNVRGVTEGFKRELDIVGVGYRAEVKGKEVVFQLGYSHPVRFAIPEGIDIAVEPRPATSPSPASTSRRSGRPRPRSARSASPIRTRAKASSTPTK